MEKRFFLILRIILTIALVVVLFKLVPYRKLAEIFKSAKVAYILAGFAVFFCASVLVAIRCAFSLFGFRHWALLSFSGRS